MIAETARCEKGKVRGLTGDNLSPVQIPPPSNVALTYSLGLGDFVPCEVVIMTSRSNKICHVHALEIYSGNRILD